MDTTRVAIVSGGNVDGGLLASLLRRRETEEGRRVRLFTLRLRIARADCRNYSRWSPRRARTS